MKVYGIKNCDTVKKALNWLDAHHIKYDFHDFKKLGVSSETLEAWSAKLGWEPLINKKGTTWKQLDPAVKESIVSKEKAFFLMQEKPSVIKRPVIETDQLLLQGFDEAAYNQLVD